MCVYGWAGWWWTCWWAFWKPVVESGRCHLCCRKWSEPCSSFGSRPAGARWTPVSGPRRGHGRTCPLSSTGQIGPRWYTWILGQGLSLHAQPQGSRQGKGRCHPQTCRRAFNKRSNKKLSPILLSHLICSMCLGSMLFLRSAQSLALLPVQISLYLL